MLTSAFLRASEYIVPPSMFNPPHLEQMGWFKDSPKWMWEHPTMIPEFLQVKALATTYDDEHIRVIRFTRFKKGGGVYYIAYRGGVGLDKNLASEYKDRLNIYYAYDLNSKDPVTRFIKALKLGGLAVQGHQVITFDKVEKDIAFVSIGPRFPMD